MIEVTYVDELMPILNLELYPSYQNDWQRFNYTSRLFQSLFELQDFYLTKVEATSPELMTQTYQVGEILDARNEPLNIANSIYRLIDKTDDHMEKFFLGCYQYLVAVDGVFDQTIRALYVLASIFYKEPKTLANSRSLDVEHRDDRRTRNEEDRNRRENWSLRAWLELYLGGYEKADALYEGYNSNLRNSIAHANFSYNKETKKITFRDFDRDGRPSCEPFNLELNELFDRINKVMSVSNYTSHFLAFLAVNDLVKADVLQPRRPKRRISRSWVSSV